MKFFKLISVFVALMAASPLAYAATSQSPESNCGIASFLLIIGVSIIVGGLIFKTVENFYYEINESKNEKTIDDNG